MIRRAWTDDEKGTAAALYAEGISAKEIASTIGRSHSSVANMIHKAELPSGSPRVSDMMGRFEFYVTIDTISGCWIWNGSRDKHGYGQMRFGRSLRYATHVSLELSNRRLPKGMFACHHCDNPRCVNPSHLFHGTQADNMRDCVEKGRHVPPPRSGVAASAERTAERMAVVCGPEHKLGKNRYVWRGVARCRACTARTRPSRAKIRCRT